MERAHGQFGTSGPFSGRGCNKRALVDLLDQLSNPLSILSPLVRDVQWSDDWLERGVDSPAEVHNPLPQVQNRLSPEQVAELVDSYLAGTRVNDLARTYGINRTTVLEHLRRQGIQRRRPRRINQVDIDKAVRLYAAGGLLKPFMTKLQMSLRLGSKNLMTSSRC